MPQPVCAIIGAGEGLGKALATKFANNGFNLALVSRSQAGSAAALHAATTITPNVKFFQADAEKPETIEAALARVAAIMGEIHVLIYNCRGRFSACAPLDMTYDALTKNFNVEVIGALAAAKSVLPAMIKGPAEVFFFQVQPLLTEDQTLTQFIRLVNLAFALYRRALPKHIPLMECTLYMLD